MVTPELINFSLQSYYIKGYINQAFKIYEKKLKKNKKKIFLSFTLSFMVYNLTHKTDGQLGELAETTSLLRMRTRKGTEGSNPSLSATSYLIPKNRLIIASTDLG